MPIATVVSDTKREELTTCPGGYVIIRRMTYGEKLQRQDEMLSMRADKDSNFEMSMLNKKAALSDFAKLIVEHNLTDENEQLLNFKNPQDVVKLDPRVGDEIGALIDGINAFENVPETKNS